MSQCDAILAVLKDGLPHRMEEIHQRVGTCRLNSRISELRKRGHVIECDKSRGIYTYLLVATPRAGEPKAPSTSGGLSLDTLRRVDVSSPAPGVDLQLGLWGSAASPRARHEAAA